MNGALALTFGSHPITVLEDERGELVWFADEVCAVLGIGNSRMALARLDDDEKGVTTTDTIARGPQRKATINESGLYSLILRSRKPEAKAFKRWVTHEVLPQIRRTGSYAPDDLAARVARLEVEVGRMRPALPHPTTPALLPPRLVQGSPEHAGLVKLVQAWRSGQIRGFEPYPKHTAPRVGFLPHEVRALLGYDTMAPVAWKAAGMLVTQPSDPNRLAVRVSNHGRLYTFERRILLAAVGGGS